MPVDQLEWAAWRIPEIPPFVLEADKPHLLKAEKAMIAYPNWETATEAESFRELGDSRVHWGIDPKACL